LIGRLQRLLERIVKQIKTTLNHEGMPIHGVIDSADINFIPEAAPNSAEGELDHTADRFLVLLFRAVGSPPGRWRTLMAYLHKSALAGTLSATLLFPLAAMATDTINLGTSNIGFFDITCGKRFCNI
jgi:hypothetical protein